MTTINTTYSGEMYTELGTRIVKSGSDLDKNSFLTILAAQLSNLDPTQDVDSTQYVSQLAQFASMEQMANLNNTMTDYSNRDLVGKGVTVSYTNAEGTKYTGIVASVTSVNGSGYISMIVNENGKNVYMDFPIDSIESVVNVADGNVNNTTNINGNLEFMFASSLIGKDVEVQSKDSNGNLEKPIKGVVIGSYKENGIVYVKVEQESGEVKSYAYNNITKVGEISDSE